MWKTLASLGLSTLLGTSAFADEIAVPPPAQRPQNPWFASKPTDNTFADPFFAPPGGAAVTDLTKPGSGEAPADLLAPPCVPFRPERMWLATDFYHAAGQGTLLPALVTSAPNGAALGTAGALGQPTTTTLFGGRRELTGFRPGIRANAGYWLTEDSRFGIDGTFLYVGNSTASFAGSTNASGAILAQPVTFETTGTAQAVPVSVLGTGSISASAASAIIGGDANFRCGVTTSERGRLDLIVGYRYVRLRDSVDVASLGSSNLAALNLLAGLPNVNTAISDSFRTLNQFHGGQIGLGGTHRIFDRLTLTTKAMVALGVNISDVTISGSTISPLGNTSTGLLTGTSNIGNTRDRFFAVIPEGTVKLGWDFTDRFRVNAGYSILYWNQVRRAADQIDTTILAPGRPMFPNASTDYWMQGWTVGLDLRY